MNIFHPSFGTWINPFHPWDCSGHTLRKKNFLIFFVWIAGLSISYCFQNSSCIWRFAEWTHPVYGGLLSSTCSCLISTSRRLVNEHHHHISASGRQLRLWLSFGEIGKVFPLNFFLYSSEAVSSSISDGCVKQQSHIARTRDIECGNKAECSCNAICELMIREVTHRDL